MRRVGGGIGVGDLSRGERNLVFDQYKASIAKATSCQGRRTRAVLDMHSWVKAVGVDIMSSKTAERDRRRVERGAQLGKCAPPSSLLRENFHNRNKYFDRDSMTQDPLGDSGGTSSVDQRVTSRGAAVPEVVALDGFLSDLQGRVVSLEMTAGIEHTPMSSSSDIATGSIAPYGRSISEVEGPSKASPSDLYGIPVEVMANAIEVRQYDTVFLLYSRVLFLALLSSTNTLKTNLLVLSVIILYAVPGYNGQFGVMDTLRDGVTNSINRSSTIWCLRRDDARAIALSDCFVFAFYRNGSSAIQIYLVTLLLTFSFRDASGWCFNVLHFT